MPDCPFEHCLRPLTPCGEGYQCLNLSCAWCAGGKEDIAAAKKGYTAGQSIEQGWKFAGTSYTARKNADHINQALAANRAIYETVKRARWRNATGHMLVARAKFVHSARIDRSHADLFACFLTRTELKYLRPLFLLLNPEGEFKIPRKGDWFACIPFMVNPHRVGSLHLYGVGTWEASEERMGYAGHLTWDKDNRPLFVCSDAHTASDLLLVDPTRRVTLLSLGVQPVLPPVDKVLVVTKPDDLPRVSTLRIIFPEATVATCAHGEVKENGPGFSELCAKAILEKHRLGEDVEGFIRSLALPEDAVARCRELPPELLTLVSEVVRIRKIMPTKLGYRLGDSGKRISDFTVTPIRRKATALEVQVKHKEREFTSTIPDFEYWEFGRWLKANHLNRLGATQGDLILKILDEAKGLKIPQEI